MGLTRGTLKKDNIGFSMPAHAPLFPAPPYEYQDATLLVFEYLTDPASAARMVPAQADLIEPPEAPGKAVAGLVFARYPTSTLGPYLEVVQFLACLYQGKSVQFATHLYVTSDVAMAAGREMGGYPKKIAKIDIDGDPDSSFSATLERPIGETLVSASLSTLNDPEPVSESESILNYLTLRIIPSPTRDAPPSLAQLILSDWQILGGQKQVGVGSLTIPGRSDLDPLHFAPNLHLLESKLVRAKTLRVTANSPDPSRLQPF